MLSFLIGFASIAFMITIHETGHFIAARMSNIDVEVFAIGWGKAIKKWHRNGTEFRINFFILGGYCKLKGGEDIIAAIEEHEESFSKHNGSLFSAHPLKRIITYAGGPVINLLLAFLLFIPFFMLDYQASSDPPTILLTSDYSEVYPNPTMSAKEAGLLSGDTILSINGQKVAYFSQISEYINNQYKDSPLLVIAERDGVNITTNLTPEFDEVGNRYIIGVTAALPAIISNVSPLTPEHIAGLESKDTIINVNGKDVTYSLDVVRELIRNPKHVIMNILDSNGNQKEVSFYPEKDSNGNLKSNIMYSSSISLFSGESIFKAIGSSFLETINSVKETYYLFGQLIRGKFSFTDSLAGPIRISYIIGQMSMTGIRSFLQLLAMISISLGIANLLPLPGLDGGSVVLSLIELIRNKSFSPKTYLRVQTVGVFILALLMLFVLFSDARFLFS